MLPFAIIAPAILAGIGTADLPRSLATVSPTSSCLLSGAVDDGDSEDDGPIGMRPEGVPTTDRTPATGVDVIEGGVRIRAGMGVMNDIRLETVGYEPTNPTSGIGMDSPSMETDPGLDLGIGYGIPLGDGFEVEIATGLGWNGITDFRAELSGPLAVPMAFEAPPLPAFPDFDPRYQYPVVAPGPPQSYEPKYPPVGGGPTTPWWPGATEGPNGGTARIITSGGSGNIYQIPLTVNASWGLKYRELACRVNAGLGVQVTYIEVGGIQGELVEVPFVPGANFGDAPISDPVRYEASFSSWSASFRYEVGLSLEYPIDANTRLGGYLRYAGASPFTGGTLELSPTAPSQYVLPDLKVQGLGTLSVGLRLSVAF